MRIFDLRSASFEGTSLIHAQVMAVGATKPKEIWYRFEGLNVPAEPCADAFVTAMLPSCMLDREPCRTESAISPDVRTNLTLTQGILSQTFDDLAPIRIEAAARDAGDSTRGRGVACCFSGGLNSWYSLLRHLNRVTHLLVFRGLDIGLGEKSQWSETYEGYRQIADILGKRLIVCETNLRDIADRPEAMGGPESETGFWHECLRNVAYLSGGLAVRHAVGELIIPARPPSRHAAFGELERHWHERLSAIVYDGLETPYSEKVHEVAVSEVARDTVRIQSGLAHNGVFGDLRRAPRRGHALQ